MVEVKKKGAILYYVPIRRVRRSRAVALNVKNAEVERLVAEVARLTGETKTEAIRRALRMRSLQPHCCLSTRRRHRLRRVLLQRRYPRLHLDPWPNRSGSSTPP